MEIHTWYWQELEITFEDGKITKFITWRWREGHYSGFKWTEKHLHFYDNNDIHHFFKWKHIRHFASKIYSEDTKVV